MVSKACNQLIMNQKNNCSKAQIDYPCKWLYKVIGSEQDELYQAISTIIPDIPYEINLSNTSSSGKYLCVNLELTVRSEEERNLIYVNLKAHPNIKIVL